MASVNSCTQCGFVASSEILKNGLCEACHSVRCDPSLRTVPRGKTPWSNRKEKPDIWRTIVFWGGKQMPLRQMYYERSKISKTGVVLGPVWEETKLVRFVRYRKGVSSKPPQPYKRRSAVSQVSQR